MDDLQGARSAVLAAGAPGAITLARHGRPALSRRVKLSAQQYGDWWADYEIGGLDPAQSPPPALRAAADSAKALFSSTRRRATESAEALGVGRPFVSDPVFVEAPLPAPPWPAFVRFSPVAWGTISRTLWWFFNHHGGQETRRLAETRAELAAERLLAAARDGEVFLIAHGFFNAMVGRALRARGWRCTQDGGYGYWSARRFEISARGR